MPREEKAEAKNPSCFSPLALSSTWQFKLAKFICCDTAIADDEDDYLSNARRKALRKENF